MSEEIVSGGQNRVFIRGGFVYRPSHPWSSKKRITERAKAAIQNLSGAGIKFTVASARSPREMMMVVDQITVSAPFAAFNGGILGNRAL